MNTTLTRLSSTFAYPLSTVPSSTCKKSTMAPSAAAAFCISLPVRASVPRRPPLSTRRPVTAPVPVVRACATPADDHGLRNANNVNSTKAEEESVRVRVYPADDEVGKVVASGIWESAGKALTAFDENEDTAGARDRFAVAWIAGRAVGAGKMTPTQGNAKLERVYVAPEWRGKGTGRALVMALLRAAREVEGAVYVRARPTEFGFYSLLGFEAQGPETEGGRRVMVLRVPECAPSAGCVGLHHTSVRVRDIERSLAFYGGVGFFVTDKFVTAGGNRACFVEGLGTRLELVEVGEHGKGGVASTFGSGAGFDRLVFDVTRACTDLDTYVAHLRRRNGGALNVRGVTATQVVGKYVVSVATVEDVDGLPIEFIRREAHVPESLRTQVKW